MWCNNSTMPNSLPLDVILKAEGEIQTTAFILQPFVLKDEEIEEEKDLLLSHFYMLTTQYQKVVEAGGKVIDKRLDAEAARQAQEAYRYR